MFNDVDEVEVANGLNMTDFAKSQLMKYGWTEGTVFKEMRYFILLIILFMDMVLLHLKYSKTVHHFPSLIYLQTSM